MGLIKHSARHLQEIGQPAAQQLTIFIAKPAKQGPVDLDDTASGVEDDVAARSVLEKVLQK